MNKENKYMSTPLIEETTCPHSEFGACRDCEISSILSADRTRLIEKVEGLKKKFNPETEDENLVDPFHVDGYNYALAAVLFLLREDNIK